ncbi:hypothetical protein CXU17_07395 [Akkermansia muciniphila]|nr:hypothetical protein CXU17_07395 [Akkermansia muciniphila]
MPHLLDRKTIAEFFSLWNQRFFLLLFISLRYLHIYSRWLSGEVSGVTPNETWRALMIIFF